jgi:hypothetical protein
MTGFGVSSQATEVSSSCQPASSVPVSVSQALAKLVLLPDPAAQESASQEVHIKANPATP